MEWPSLGVDQATLAKVIHVLELVAVETSGDVDTWKAEGGSGRGHLSVKDHSWTFVQYS